MVSVYGKTDTHKIILNRTHVQIALLFLLASGYGGVQYALAKKRGDEWVHIVSLRNTGISLGVVLVLLLLTSETFPRVAVAGSLSVFALIVLLTTKQTRDVLEKIVKITSRYEPSGYWNGYRVRGKP